MRVWIFNPFDDIPLLCQGSGGQAPEGKPQRYWTLAATLADQGHEVVWWSSDFSHRRKVQRTAARGQKTDVCTEPTSHIPYPGSRIPFQLRLITTPSYRMNISLARIWNHRAYGKGLYRDAVAAIESGELVKPDVILASLPPMEGPIAALRLRKRYGCKVISDIMDAWPETLLQALPGAKSGECGVESGKFFERPLTSVLRPLSSVILSPYFRMLRRACQESDALSAQSQTFADFAPKYGAKGEIHVCYLGGEPGARSREPEPPHREAVPPSLEKAGSFHATPKATQDTVGGGVGNLEGNAPSLPPDAEPCSHQRTTSNQQPSKLRLLYLGAMGRSYDLETLVAACGRLLALGQGLELHFAGEGEKLTLLQTMTKDWPDGAVRFHGFLQEGALQDLLEECDLGIVPMFPESGVAVPYKVGDYLSAGLPVVNSLPGELKALLDQYGCGQFYEAGSVTELESSLQHYLELSPEAFLQSRTKARALFDAHFDRSKTYPAFAKWVGAVASPPS